MWHMRILTLCASDFKKIIHTIITIINTNG